MTTPTLTLVATPDPDDRPDHEHQADTVAEVVELTPPSASGSPVPPGPDDLALPPPPGPHAVALPPPTPVLPPAPTAANVEILAVEELWQPPVEQRDVLPAWFRNRAARRVAMRWWFGHVRHLAKFHGIRLPLYFGRIALRSPVGAGRGLRAVGRWVVDTRTRIEREALVETVRSGTGAPQLTRMRQLHRNAVLARSVGLAVMAPVPPMV